MSNDRKDRPDKAFYFDGIDDYISIAKYPSLDTLSISLWVIDSGGNPNPKSLNPRYVSSEFCNGGFAIAHNREFSSGSGKNTFLFTRNRGNSSSNMISSYKMPLNTLTFICITFNGQIFNLYVNGILDTSITNIGNVIQGDSIYFGKSGCAAFGTITDGLKGTMDDIGFWNRELSQQEIQSLYNSTSVGISELKYEQEYSIYPNPTSNNLSVANINHKSDVKFIMCNKLGQIVAEGTLSKFDTIIDLTLLTEGIYFLTIDSANQQSYKVIKY